jgi:1-acyl-sn-glycerol-3-phosphate acyltransferase
MVPRRSIEANSAAVTSTKSSTTSRFSPWLTPLAYWLGLNVVFPAYFGRITVTGQEHLPHSGPVILAPLHRSRWDALLIPYAAGRHITGRDLRFMVSADEVKGIQGWFIRRLGGFAINQRRPDISSLRHGIEILKQREMMVIFPEGWIYRYPNGQIHPLKPGLARMALQAEQNNPELGVKIVPISISYSQPFPSWGTEVDVHIGEPLEVADYCQGNLKAQAQQLTQKLQSELCRLSNGEETESSNLTFSTASTSS